jgi:peptidyl-prolyl cis-trans isomerase C
MQMQLFKVAKFIALPLVGALIGLAVYAEDKTNVAVVNGVPIPQSRMDFIVKSQVQQGQKDSPELRAQIKDVLVTRELIAQDAAKKGLDKSAEVQTQLDMAKQEFLIRAYFDDLLKTAQPSDAQLHAEYDKIKGSQEGAKRTEYKARHILVKTEAEAKAVLASLNKTGGKNFAALAKQKSTDKGSKEQGGLLDWSDGSQYVPEFTAAMSKLDKGKYTTVPVKTRFGYHIILLEDTRPVEFPPFDQVKDKVSQEMLKQARDKKIEELKAAAKIE